MLWWTLQNVLIAACLAGVVWLLCRWPRLYPAARHALWLVVLLKLLTPPLVVWPWAIPLPARFSANVPLAAVPLESSSAELVEVDAPALPEPIPLAADDEPTETFSPSQKTIALAAPSLAESWHPFALSSTRTLLTLAAVIWVLGSLTFALIEAARIVRMQRTLRRSSPPDPALARQLREVADRIGLRNIPVRQVSGLGTPLVWALGRPTLLWPAELTLPRSSLQALLIHELAHVKRRDHWVGWLELIAGCVWWFNPLFWYVRHQLRENAELACDAWVIAAMPDSRRAYAEALLSICERISCPPAALAVGVTSGGRRSLERRLAMIFRQRVPERLSSPALLCVLILLAAALPAWSQKLGSGDTQRPGLPFSEFIGLDDSSSTRAAIDTGTSSTSTSTSTDPLPSDAAALLQQFGRTQTEIRREADKKIAEQREQLLRELKELQDRYTREAKLDEAVAIRDQIRELRVRALTGGQTLADPGSMYRYRDRIGQTLFFDIVGATNQYVWGTDVYTDDSSLATAAVHAGVLRPGQKGIVRVTIVASPQNFQGSTRNGVTSYPWGTWSGAYRVEPVDATLTRTTSTTSSDSPNWSRLAYPRRTEASQIILMEVVGDTTGYVWGTDVYTDDSIVATAAVHAGLLQPGERGTLQMIILPGRNSYEGSTRNGVTSYSFPNWPRSFRLQKVSGATTTSPLRNYYNSKTLSATMPGAAMGYAPIPFPFSVSPGSVLYTDVVGSSSGYAWGTDIYTSDSSLATAAVHSGLLKDGERGRLKVTYLEGRDNYPSTTRNGVTSQTWAAYPSSIRLELAEKAGPP